MRFYAELMDYMANGVDELDDGKKKDKKPATPKEKEPHKCPICFHVHNAAPVCPACGHVYAVKSVPSHKSGELREIGGTGSGRGNIHERPQFYAMLRHHAKRLLYKIGWANFKFKERFGVWPHSAWQHDPVMEPSDEMKKWIKSRQIAWIKRRKSA